MREQLDELYQSDYEQLLAISRALLAEKAPTRYLGSQIYYYRTFLAGISHD